MTAVTEPLREAIIAANNTAGTDYINFNARRGRIHHHIISGSALPTITDAVFIDGWSEPATAARLVIG